MPPKNTSAAQPPEQPQQSTAAASDEAALVEQLYGIMTWSRGNDAKYPFLTEPPVRKGDELDDPAAVAALLPVAEQEADEDKGFQAGRSAYSCAHLARAGMLKRIGCMTPPCPGSIGDSCSIVWPCESAPGATPEEWSAAAGNAYNGVFLDVATGELDLFRMHEYPADPATGKKTSFASTRISPDDQKTHFAWALEPTMRAVILASKNKRAVECVLPYKPAGITIRATLPYVPSELYEHLRKQQANERKREQARLRKAKKDAEAAAAAAAAAAAPDGDGGVEDAEMPASPPPQKPAAQLPVAAAVDTSSAPPMPETVMEALQNTKAALVPGSPAVALLAAGAGMAPPPPPPNAKIADKNQPASPVPGKGKGKGKGKRSRDDDDDSATCGGGGGGAVALDTTPAPVKKAKVQPRAAAGPAPAFWQVELREPKCLTRDDPVPDLPALLAHLRKRMQDGRPYAVPDVARYKTFGELLDNTGDGMYFSHTLGLLQLLAPELRPDQPAASAFEPDVL